MPEPTTTTSTTAIAAGANGAATTTAAAVVVALVTDPLVAIMLTVVMAVAGVFCTTAWFGCRVMTMRFAAGCMIAAVAGLGLLVANEEWLSLSNAVPVLLSFVVGFSVERLPALFNGVASVASDGATSVLSALFEGLSARLKKKGGPDER